MAPIQEPSSYRIQRISQYVSLSPAALAQPLPAVCATILSPLLLSYFPPARGIVLAYEDVELSSTPPSSNTPTRSDLLLRHVDEYFAPFVWVTASFLVFSPQRNAHITGRITHQSSTHITLAHLNTFPVSVTKDYLPSDWTFHSESTGRVKRGWDGRVADEGGWWVDGEGEKVDGDLTVRMRDFDGKMDGKARGKGFLRIEGSLITVEEEGKRAEKAKGRKRQKAVPVGVLRTQQQRS
jgi:DNA-directed RNA polymerase I subunit RPA43